MSVRYGTKIRKKVASIKAQKVAKYECPRCGKHKLKRISNALFSCSSCGRVMAGGAFTPETLSGKSALKLISRETE
ncbi:MAG: 50S ribosomal protein L37ae [Candidatus Micrarchaeota archaeon]